MPPATALMTDNARTRFLYSCAIDQATFRPGDAASNPFIDHDFYWLDENAFMHNFAISRQEFKDLFLRLQNYLRTAVHISELRNVRPRDILLICLRCFATGSSIYAVSARYRITPTVVGIAVMETCAHLYLTAAGRHYESEPTVKLMSKEYFMNKHQGESVTTCSMHIDVDNRCLNDGVVLKKRPPYKYFIVNVEDDDIQNAYQELNDEPLFDPEILRIIRQDIAHQRPVPPLGPILAMRIEQMSSKCIPSVLICMTISNAKLEALTKRYSNKTITEYKNVRTYQIAMEVKKRFLNKFRIISEVSRLPPTMIGMVITALAALYNHLYKSPWASVPSPRNPFPDITPEHLPSAGHEPDSLESSFVIHHYMALHENGNE